MDWKLKWVVASALAATATAAFAQEGPLHTEFAEFTVTADEEVGTLKALRGVNGPPDMAYRQEAFDTRFIQRPLDLSDAYREAAITLVRTHDAFGAGDIDTNMGDLEPIRVQGAPGGMPVLPMETIFPDPAADPSDPASYNFVQSDRLILGIRSIGADVLFRIGRTGGTTAPPPDPARYADIVRHVVDHYNNGWANGFYDTVKYWELWNEPDFGPLWWRGTPEEFFELYGHVAPAVKSADPDALVGGPAIAADNNVQAYREGFLDFVQERRLPLDFFSWHHYAEAHDPWEFVVSARDIRGLLDERGFTNTISVMDEWNSSVIRGMRAAGAEQAAFVATSRIYMQDAPIDLDGYYRPDGAFGIDGDSPNKVGQALLALGRMAQTPLRLATTGGDDKGLAIQAGRSTDGTTFNILISNYEIPADQRGPREGSDQLTLPGLFTFDLLSRRSVSYSGNRGYDLAVSGLVANRSYTVERYRISDQHDFALVERRFASGSDLRIAAELAAPAIELIVIRDVSGPR